MVVSRSETLRQLIPGVLSGVRNGMFEIFENWCVLFLFKRKKLSDSHAAYDQKQRTLTGVG